MSNTLKQLIECCFQGYRKRPVALNGLKTHRTLLKE